MALLVAALLTVGQCGCYTGSAHQVGLTQAKGYRHLLLAGLSLVDELLEDASAHQLHVELW